MEEQMDQSESPVHDDTEAGCDGADIDEDCCCPADDGACSEDRSDSVDAECDEDNDSHTAEKMDYREDSHRPDCPPDAEPYTIAPGDTYSHLSQRFNTTAAAIVSANPSVDPDDLRVGQVICIPRGPVHSACPEGTREYTVRRGDTFFLLARRFNTTVDAIIEANPDVDPDALLIGMTLCIPEPVTPPPRECPEGTREYTIRRGDTLFSLARRHSTTVDAIIEANPGIDPDRLRIGQVICIPRATATHPHMECPSWASPYRVRAYETLFQIANRHRLTLEDMLEANPHLKDPDHLEKGQIICLPDRERPQK